MNRKGSGYIYACILVIIGVLFLTLLMSFLGAATQIQHQNENTEKVLDSFVVSNAIDIYDSIKMGNDDTVSLDSSEFTQKLSAFCGLDLENGSLYCHNRDGNPQYLLTRPVLTAVRAGNGSLTLKVTVHYIMRVPVYFCGVLVSTANVPIYIHSYYTPKF